MKTATWLTTATIIGALLVLTSCRDINPPIRSLAPFHPEELGYAARDLDGYWYVETPEAVSYAMITNGVIMLYQTNGTQRMVCFRSFNIKGRQYADVLVNDMLFNADSKLALFSSVPVHILCVLEYKNDTVDFVTLNGAAVLKAVETGTVTGAVASATNSMFMTVSTAEWQSFLAEHAGSKELRGESLIELRRFSSAAMTALSPHILTPHAETVTARVVMFAWPPTREALGYRFELSTDQDFFMDSEIERRVYAKDQTNSSMDLVALWPRRSGKVLYWRVQPMLSEKPADRMRALWTGPAVFTYAPPKPGKVAQLTIKQAPAKPVADGTSLVMLVVYAANSSGRGVADTPILYTVARYLADTAGTLLQPQAIRPGMLYSGIDSGGLVSSATGQVWNSVIVRTDSAGYARVTYSVPHWQECMANQPLRLTASAVNSSAPAARAEAALMFARPSGGSDNAHATATAALLPRLLGVWELKAKDDTTRTIKIITPTHFAWYEYERENRGLRRAAGGTYALEGTTYTERVEFGGWLERHMVGHDQVISVRIHGDTLQQTWYDDQTNLMQDVWQRVAF